MERQPTGFYNNVKEELKTHLNKKLERLWHEGISGADFFIAAIGSAIEVFGKYEQVMDYEGNVVRADRLLLDVRKIATDYAVRQILHNGFAGEISDLPGCMSYGAGTTARQRCRSMKPANSGRAAVSIYPMNGVIRVSSRRKKNLSGCSARRSGNWRISKARRI